MKGKGYFIGERASVLEYKHIKAMGPSRWLFSWAVRRQTGTNKDGWGVVLYGNTITYEAIGSDLGAPAPTLRRWMTRLIKKGYLKTIRKPHGFKLFIAKPQKLRRKSEDKPTDFPQSDRPEMDTHDRPEMDAHNSSKTLHKVDGHSNKPNNVSDLENIQEEITPSSRNGRSLVDDHSRKSNESLDVREKVDDHRSTKALEVKDLRRKELLPPSASVNSPPPKIQNQTLKPTPPQDVAVGSVSAVAAHKFIGLGQMSDAAIEQRRQKLKREFAEYLSRAMAITKTN